MPGNMYQLKRHIAMTEALSGMYDKMYYIELREKFIKSISSTDPVQEVSYQSIMRQITGYLMPVMMSFGEKNNVQK